MTTLIAPDRAAPDARPTASPPAGRPLVDAPPPRASDGPFRRRVRPVLFWLHLIAGSALGLVILTQALTGISIAYRRQIVDAVIARQPAPHPAAAVRLPLDTIVARAAAATGVRAVGITLRRDTQAPVIVQLDGRRTVYVDAYSGAVLPGAPRLQAFFAYMEGVHRWLAVTGTRSPLGEAATATSVLAFLFLLLSGLYLWIPARWTRPAVRAVTVVRRGARGRARNWNLHHVAGLWASPVLLVVTVTGVFMAYDWPGRLLARATGSPVAEEGPPRGAAPGRAMPAAGTLPRPGRGGAGAAESTQSRASLDTLAARALAVVPGPWYAVQLRLGGERGRGRGPGRPGANGVTADVTGSANLRPDLRTHVTLDPATGAVRSTQRYTDQDVAQRARSWMHPVHSGEGFGVLGATIAVVGALAATVLVWTGLALALRRLQRRLARA